MAASRTLTYAVLAALFGVSPAAAQGTKQSPARITPTSASSTCIGSAGTPVCAAETLMACLARSDDAMCRRVGAVLPSRTDSAPPLQAEYAVERVSVIRPEDITDDTRDLEWFKPGYTLVEISRRSCAASERTCEDVNWEYVQVYLRPAAGQWQVVTWRGDAEDDTAPEPPDGFQGREEPAG